MKLTQIGWVVAAALGVAAVTVGFQGQTMKVGTVDVARVFTESDYYKTQNDNLKAYVQTRQDMMQFVDQYRTFTADQATRYHDLSLKAGITPTEKGELDKIKGDVQKADSRLKELQTKTNATPAETTELNELSNRVRATGDIAQRWAREMQDDFQTQQQTLQKAGMDKVRDAIKQVASAQGYTLVFSNEVAPYGASEITDAAIKAMNKK